MRRAGGLRGAGPPPVYFQKIRRPQMSSETPILEMKNITKVYANGIVANRQVHFSVRKGEIHGLIGENGAGKSTLMNILFGGQQADEGSILLDGKAIEIHSPMQAIGYGIGMVHQHYALVPSMTVAENVFLGDEPRTRHGLIDRETEVKRTKELSDLYHFQLNPSDVVRDLSVGTKQKIEILKALIRGARILILDEPTAVLTPQETEELFRELELFKKNGHTIIFISHKLNEVKEICDRITVMKHGHSVGCYETAGMNEGDISKLMIGRDAVNQTRKEPAKPGEEMLSVRNLSAFEDGVARLKSVSLSIRRGEILGIAGVEGNGQQELVECIAGLRRTETGEILLENREIRGLSLRKIRELGISYISEDRIGQGTAGEASIESNIIADKLLNGRMMKGPFIDRKKSERFTEEQIRAYAIRADSMKQPVRMLSGGNMQKVVIARELSDEPKLLIANQPTRGVDVGAMQFIHASIIALRDRGAGVILVSSDLNEVLEVSDRIAVMYDGQLAAFFGDVRSVSEEELGFYMLGVKHQEPDEIRKRMAEA